MNEYTEYKDDNNDDLTVELLAEKAHEAYFDCMACMDANPLKGTWERHMIDMIHHSKKVREIISPVICMLLEDDGKVRDLLNQHIAATIVTIKRTGYRGPEGDEVDDEEEDDKPKFPGCLLIEGLASLVRKCFYSLN